MKPVGTTGRVDEEGWLHLNKPLTTVTPGEYQVLLLSAQGMTSKEIADRLQPVFDLLLRLLSDDSTDEREWLRAATRNPAFDFLKDSVEDIYTPADGLTKGP